MSAENRPSFTLPDLHPECKSCVFAKRAIQKAEVVGFNEGGTVECRRSGGGGSQQVKPGKWVDFESRIMAIKPVISIPNEKYEGLSDIPVCPHFGIKNLGKEYPHIPSLTWWWTSPLGDRYDVTKDLLRDNSLIPF